MVNILIIAFCFKISYFSLSMLPDMSSLIFAEFLTFLQFWANLSVLIVSRIDYSDGETLAIIVVFALPPKEFFNKRVNFESLYQMKPFGLSAS